MRNLTSDVRYAARAILARPSFSLAVVATLALGIGPNTAIFSLLDAVLLRPLPYAEPDRLVAVDDVYQGRAAGVGQDEFLDWIEHATLFENLALAGFDAAVIPPEGDAEAERIVGGSVTASFFDVLGVKPLHGRTFLLEEDLPTPADVVVLSHALWQRRFGGRPEVVGQRSRFGERSCTIVGVMPASFYWIQDRGAEFWRPLGRVAWGRAAHQFSAVGRLKPGVTLTAAQAQMDALARRAEEHYPDARGWGIRVLPLGREEADAARVPLLVLAMAVGLVLLVTCANVGNLMLVRTAARSREIAIRSALGAGRDRVVRQLLMESGILVFGGAVLGVLLSYWLLRAFVAGMPPDMTLPGTTVTRRGMELPATFVLDTRVLAFSLLLAVLTTALVGLAPAYQTWRRDLLQGLKRAGAAGGAGAGRRLVGHAVVLEVALAAVLLVVAGLLLTSLNRLLHQDLGFRHERVLTMQVGLPGSRYAAAQRVTFFDEFLQRIEALPGVESAAATSALPMSGVYSGSGFEIEGRPVPAEWRELSGQNCAVTPGYFHTMGIPLVGGRSFTAADRNRATPAVVISQSMARRHWPNEDPVGRRIRYRGAPVWLTIVGVVGDTRYGGPTREPNPTIYLPYALAPPSGLFIAVRLDSTAADRAVLPAIRGVLRQLDASVPLMRVARMDDLLASTLVVERLVTALLSGFAVLALLLAAVGLYGVVTQVVAQRTQEIGVRMALGATRQHVLGMVLRRGLLLAGVGAVLGVLLAAAATRALAALLHGVSATDPIIFAGVPLLLGSVALVASYLPARRAASIDPIVALRAE